MEDLVSLLTHEDGVHGCMHAALACGGQILGGCGGSYLQLSLKKVKVMLEDCHFCLVYLYSI